MEPTAIMPNPDEARIGCYCENLRKPCTYHEGYADGWEALMQALNVDIEDDLDTPAPWEHMDSILQPDNGSSLQGDEES